VVGVLLSFVLPELWVHVCVWAPPSWTRPRVSRLRTVTSLTVGVGRTELTLLSFGQRRPRPAFRA